MFNFVLNNIFMYYDRCLSGFEMIKGWISFCIVLFIGVIVNVGILVYFYN